MLRMFAKGAMVFKKFHLGSREAFRMDGRLREKAASALLYDQVIPSSAGGEQKGAAAGSPLLLPPVPPPARPRK